eukprot:Mrub_00841.p1 GENE.Mrub_00841~~Mrub_00841.p1  ORF type:complete len:540 (+),score=84.94 Mrub_00841:169-1620(+)
MEEYNTLLNTNILLVLSQEKDFFVRKLKYYKTQEGKLYVEQNGRIKEGPEITEIMNKLTKNSQSKNTLRDNNDLKDKLSANYSEYYKCKHFLNLVKEEENCKIHTFKSYNNRLVILELLGTGGFGEVYRCYDSVYKHYFALKINFIPMEDKRKYYNDQGNIEREVMVGKKFSFCKGIPKIYSYFDFIHNDAISSRAFRVNCLQFKFCNKKSLDFYIKTNYFLRKDELALKIGFDILTTLYEMNKNTYNEYWIHYDLKPSNIFLHSESGSMKDDLEVYVGDWGLCMRNDTNKYSTKMASSFRPDVTELYFENYNYGAGTYYYLPPEAFNRKSEVSNKIDVFSVGVMIYELLSGKKPFCNETDQKTIFDNDLMSKYCKTYKYHPDIAKPTNKLLQILLAHDYRERPSVEDIIETKMFGSEFNWKGDIENLKTFFTNEITKAEINDRLKRKRSFDSQFKNKSMSLVDIDDFSTKDSLRNESQYKYQ